MSTRNSTYCTFEAYNVFLLVISYVIEGCILCKHIYVIYACTYTKIVYIFSIVFFHSFVSSHCIAQLAWSLLFSPAWPETHNPLTSDSWELEWWSVKPSHLMLESYLLSTPGKLSISDSLQLSSHALMGVPPSNACLYSSFAFNEWNMAKVTNNNFSLDLRL